MWELLQWGRQLVFSTQHTMAQQGEYVRAKASHHYCNIHFTIAYLASNVSFKGKFNHIHYQQWIFWNMQCTFWVHSVSFKEGCYVWRLCRGHLLSLVTLQPCWVVSSRYFLYNSCTCCPNNWNCVSEYICLLICMCVLVCVHAHICACMCAHP